MNKAVVFDLDGTLWDSRVEVAHCWENLGKKLFGDYFVMDADFVQRQMGKTMAQIKDCVRETYGLTFEQADEFEKHAFEAEVNHLSKHPGTIYNGVEQTITSLKKKGYKVFICSNCQKGYIETFLPLIKKNLFDDYICFGDTHAEKYVSILEILIRNKIDFAYYVGDTEMDKEAARKAHVLFIYAAYGFGKVTNYFEKINKFEELDILL